MRRGTLILLLFIILLAVGASYVDFWPNGKPHYGITNPFTVSQGLDLEGGTTIMLEPTANDMSKANAQAMATVQQILSERIGGSLGVKDSTVLVQHVGSTPSIVVELPKFNGNQQSAISELLKTGNLQIWNTGPSAATEGQSFTASEYTQYNPGNKPLFTGNDLNLNSLQVSQGQAGDYVVDFSMKGAAASKLGTFTANNVGNYMTITLDNQVIMSATINQQLPGSGQISGNFSLTQATQLVNTLKYGAFPITLTQVSQQTIQGTLGSEAITRSLLAGGLGLGIVILFMLIYYRLPGFLADIALILYSVMTFAVFKLIGVTMSLAGIAGFILSIGMAVDANVLIFERVKEELRAGRLMASAIDNGWKRAWPSIRDSNTSTLITCAILFAFGSNFGATIIVGFATTLFLGVVVSMFTAVVVTRTFLNLLVPTGAINHPALFGLPAGAIPAPVTTLARRRSTV
ncbi:MAG TPA: protein translocase subunit SecD [Dictyobacter sp.]|nr:protein translocase subunit SecD [Dictyobacter sp.]